jgi:hypothetical protein
LVDKNLISLADSLDLFGEAKYKWLKPTKERKYEKRLQKGIIKPKKKRFPEGVVRNGINN